MVTSTSNFEREDLEATAEELASVGCFGMALLAVVILIGLAVVAWLV